jgi:D-alanyl-D-alanine carboxypeptidase/D-alanyl-D-alanine-endopeptidase (penicillin-binding protein 4)
VVVSQNPEAKLIPASTLKIITALSALHHLGPSYRFATEFYRSPSNDLIIKGYGDPLLVSEQVAAIAAALASRIHSFRDLVVDGSYFAHPLVIPGEGDWPSAYEPPCGAVSVNFNTVHFKTQRGRIVSAEPQTPLLAAALGTIRHSGLKQGRVSLSPQGHDSTLYAGLLFQHFLKKQGLASKSRVKIGKVVPDRDQLIFTYSSPMRLVGVVAALLAHSNNFIANQLLLAAGAKAFGPPGSLSGGIAAAMACLKPHMPPGQMVMVEGSGLSRDNKISALAMAKVLDRFAPHRNLMKSRDRASFKTGTLNGVQTRAGFVETESGQAYRFVVMINTPGKPVQPVMDALLARLP